MREGGVGDVRIGREGRLRRWKVESKEIPVTLNFALGGPSASGEKRISMTRITVAAIVALMSMRSIPVAAQWLKQPTPGIPRTADGKPNLAAPAPRTADGKPDLSGIWRVDAGPYANNLVADLKPDEIPPWADALFKQRMEDLAKDDPATYHCLPQGPRAIVTGGGRKMLPT